MSNDRQLMDAVDAAADALGYAWVAGALAGAIRCGWDEARAAGFLRDAVARMES